MIFVILFTKKYSNSICLYKNVFLQKSIPLQFVFEKDFYNIYLEKNIFMNWFTKDISIEFSLFAKKLFFI